MTQHSEQPLGGFDWLDKKASQRRWFANWLARAWNNIYRDSLHQIHTKADWDRYGGMEKAVKKLAGKLPPFLTDEQLALLDAEARKFNFKTTRERVEAELGYFLRRTGQQKENAAVFKASPWCNHFANEKHTLEQTGKNLPYKLYPRDPDMQLALENVITEFGSFEIWREVSPPLRHRRHQRAFYFAVHRLCKPKDGPAKLAAFIQNLLKQWPCIPASMDFDLENYFNATKRRELVCGHLGLAELQSNKEARALWRVLHTVIFRDELRGPLLRLTRAARLRAELRRKGWGHLRNALKTVFSHIRRETSDEAMFRYFERANFPHMRNLPREQHSGDGSVIVKFTTVRVVCQNTLMLAMKDGQKAYRVRHSKQMKFKLDELAEFLAITQEVFLRAAACFRQLASIQLNQQRLDQYLGMVFPRTAAQKESGETPARWIALHEAFESLPDLQLPGVRGTLWAAYNAIAYFQDYKKPQQEEQADQRLDRTWFGGAADIKLKALEKARELAAN